MDIDTIKKFSLDELVQEIERHNKLYWKDNNPEISDEDYDALLRRLEEIDPENPLLDTVGSADVASLGKVVLSKPMISLEKTYFFKDAPKGKKSLLKWASEIKRRDDEVFLIQPKYDGISSSYSNGILATRGQGTQDENVTDKVPLIELEALGYKGPLDRAVRGEIIIRDDDFKTIYSRIKKTDGSLYKNPRNAVAGIMGLKDIKPMLAQGAKLTLVDYDMVSYSVSFSEIESRWSSLVEEIEALPYPMDGIVIKLADETYSESLGETAHHPRGQIAFKFSGLRKKTKLIGVEWSFGKNCLTPVGKIESVELGGVTISNVTLHNLANVEEKDIHIGDIVTVERAGDVIPHIVESEPGSDRKPCIISECPSCLSKLVRDDKELRCVNSDCPETNLQRILASVRNIGIEELGEPTVRKMMNVLQVKKLADIFNLALDDILKLEGFKEKSASNLYKNIQMAKDTTDYQLVASLNIHGIGQTIASKILRDYSLEELRKMTKLELSFIPEVGSEVSEKLFNGLRDLSDILDDLKSCLSIKHSKVDSTPKELICLDVESSKLDRPLSHYENLIKMHNCNRVKPSKNRDEVSLPERLKVLVTTKNPESKTSLILKAKEMMVRILSPPEWEASLPKIKVFSGAVNTKTICFTGEMPEKRSFYENLASKHGYKAVDSVTRELSILVAADISSESSKIKKARSLGTRITPIEEWLKEIEQKQIRTEKIQEDGNDGFLPGFN